MAQKNRMNNPSQVPNMLELTVNVNVVDILTVRQEQKFCQVIEDNANAVVVETTSKQRQKDALLK
jgi:hypothetical protein